MSPSRRQPTRISSGSAARVRAQVRFSICDLRGAPATCDERGGGTTCDERIATRGGGTTGDLRPCPLACRPSTLSAGRYSLVASRDQSSCNAISLGTRLVARTVGRRCPHRAVSRHAFHLGRLRPVRAQVRGVIHEARGARFPDDRRLATRGDVPSQVVRRPCPRVAIRPSQVVPVEGRPVRAKGRFVRLCNRLHTFHVDVV